MIHLKKIILISLLNVTLTLPLTAQNKRIGDALMSSNKLVAVIAVLVVILLGIAVYLWRMDRRLKDLEND